MFAMMTVVVAATDGEAHAKLADYRRYADPEGALTLMSGWTGVDFSQPPRGAPAWRRHSRPRPHWAHLIVVSYSGDFPAGLRWQFCMVVNSA